MRSIEFNSLKFDCKRVSKCLSPLNPLKFTHRFDPGVPAECKFISINVPVLICLPKSHNVHNKLIMHKFGSTNWVKFPLNLLKWCKIRCRYLWGRYSHQTRRTSALIARQTRCRCDLCHCGIRRDKSM